MMTPVCCIMCFKAPLALHWCASTDDQAIGQPWDTVRACGLTFKYYEENTEEQMQHSTSEVSMTAWSDNNNDKKKIVYGVSFNSKGASKILLKICALLTMYSTLPDVLYTPWGIQLLQKIISDSNTHAVSIYVVMCVRMCLQVAKYCSRICVSLVNSSLNHKNRLAGYRYVRPIDAGVCRHFY